MRKLLVVITIAQMFSPNTWAGGFKTAKYGSESYSFGIGGRALGMGGAYAALARDVTAIYWNPAGLAHVEFPQIMLMYAELHRAVVSYNFAGAAFPMGPVRTLGFGITRVGVDGIPVTRLTNPALKLGDFYVDENGQTRQNRPYVETYISDAEYAFYLSYAIKRSERFSYGGNVKVLHKAIGDFSAWGLGFDLSVLYNPKGGLFLGASLQDVTTTILAWDTGRREVIVPALRLGAAYPITIPMLGGCLSPALDVELRFEGRDFAAQAAVGPVSADAHVGWEYQFRDLLAVRLGSDVGNLSAGAGIRLPKLQIDYAFLRHPDLDDTHRISVRLTIQEPRFRRR